MKVRAPMRVSFLGGGSDIPSYCEKHGNGYVISTSVETYVRVSLQKRTSFSQPMSNLSAFVASAMGSSGLDPAKDYLVIESDIEGVGGGLGTSSSLAVAIMGLGQDKFDVAKRKDIAAKAATFEIETMKAPIGRQDHYASALGGLNLLTFRPKAAVEYKNLNDNIEFVSSLQNHCLLFDTRVRRNSSIVLKGLSDGVIDDVQIDKIRELAELAVLGVRTINLNDLKGFFELILASWEVKRTLTTNTSLPAVNDIVREVMNAGALAAKLLGAGAGGHILVCARPSDHKGIRQRLYRLTEIPLVFENKGVTRERG